MRARVSPPGAPPFLAFVTFVSMRPLPIVGLLLVLVGGFILVRGFSFTSQKSVVKVGDFQASVEERREVPAWAGALVVAGGIVLLTASRRRR
jgi:hypothetical protein